MMDRPVQEIPFRPASTDEAAAVEAARALIAERQCEGRHHVASSMIAADGRIFTALNLESVLAQASRCAEPAALSMARSAETPAAALIFTAAVNRRGEVIAPCGLCRELLLDWAPDIDVALPGGTDFLVAPLTSLIPVPYKAGRRTLDR